MVPLYPSAFYVPLLLCFPISFFIPKLKALPFSAMFFLLRAFFGESIAAFFYFPMLSTPFP
jgi:hypothetical protein